MADSSRKYPELYAEHARQAIRDFKEGKTQQEVGAIFGMSQSALSRAISPPNQPGLKILIQFALVTGRSLDEILGMPSADHEERLVAKVAKRLGLPPPKSDVYPSDWPRKK